MRHFRLDIHARGSLLIGGGEIPSGLHGSHIADGDGNAYVPASALRGALRETLEALLRGAGRPACDAGRGNLVDQPSPTWSACELDQGGPCAACRLFGGTKRGLGPGAREFSSLVVGDGACVGEDGWMMRPGVSIARKARSAADDRLYFRRSTKTDAHFVAEGWLREERDIPLFEAAVLATSHIGSGRSRGLARVDIKLLWEDSPAARVATLPGPEVRVRLKLQSPTILGVPLAHENLRETRREIPGAALRGMIGFALAQTLADPDASTAFQSLIHEDHGACFGFLSPVDLEGPRTEPAGHLPLTVQHCKVEGGAHGAHDDLLDRIATALITRVEQADAVHDHLRAARCSKAGCGAPLRAARGFRRRKEPVPTRVATRASLERTGQSVRDGALFTEVYLEPGTTFEGNIRKVPTEALSLLATVPGLPCSIGRGRGARRGVADIELVAAPPRESVTVRGERFDKALRAYLRRCSLPDTVVGSLVPVTLLAPAVLDDAASLHDEWMNLSQALPEDLRKAPLVSVRRFTREGTWDQRRGEMHAFTALTSGSVYVLRLSEGHHWREHLAALDSMERDGLGTRRHQGFGEVIAFDPIHTLGT